jgi:hypothetical protein
MIKMAKKQWGHEVFILLRGPIAFIVVPGGKTTL